MSVKRSFSDTVSDSRHIIISCPRCHTIVDGWAHVDRRLSRVQPDRAAFIEQEFEAFERAMREQFDKEHGGH